MSWSAPVALIFGIASPGCAEAPPAGAPAEITKKDGKPATIAVAGMGAVTVRPMRTIAKGKGTCSVALVLPKSPPQHLVLIGAGDTEALTCDGIVAFGAVPARAGRARIGFLYRGHSPNAESLTPVFIERARSGGLWSINDELGQRIGEQGELDTIPKIRVALRRSGR